MDTNEMLSSQDYFGKVVEGFSVLEKVLKETPSLRYVTEDVLREALQRIAPQASFDKTFINTRKSGIAAPEPVGSLLDVFRECHARGRAPQYDSKQYGIYSVPDSIEEKDRISDLDVMAVGTLIDEIIKSMGQRCSAVLQRHWTTSSGKDVMGRDLLPRINTLRNAYAELFWEELRATVQVQGVMAEVEESLNVFVRNKSTTPGYNIALQLVNGDFVTLDCCFVQRLNGRFDGELLPADDDWMILYTPVNGLEVFRTSALLKLALDQRLSNAESREKLLKGVALEDAGFIKRAPEIRYPKIKGELFQVCVDNLLIKQQRDYAYHVGRLYKSGVDLQEVLTSIESAQMLDSVSIDGKARMAKLIAQKASHARPQWVKKASSTNQEVFASLEQQLLSSQVALHEAMGGLSSLHEYARGVVEEHISRGQSYPADPDSIWVSVKHSVPMGSRKIEHIERKTLTQLFMYGLHDDARRYSLQLETSHSNPRLSIANIEFAVRQFDLRLKYAQMRSERLRIPQVGDAMRELLSQQIALSNFAAILQKHISPNAQNIVQRYLFGDSNMEAGSVAFRKSYRPMKDMIVFRSREAIPERATHVLYAPGAPTGQQWYEFPDMTALKRQFINWGFEAQDRDFLIAQSNSVDRVNLVDGYLSLTDSRKVFEQWWWDGVTLVPWARAPLIDAVQNLIDWENAEEKAVTPDWYRKAATADRERFTRLNTEFKAIAKVAQKPLYIKSLTEFSRERVMAALNGYLRRFDAHPHIDPDRVRVKLRGHDYMTLTQLFIQWQIWKASEPVSFFSVDNASLGRLDASVVSALINLRPGEKYEEYLREQFLDSREHELKAKLYCKTVQNEMFRAALTQKMQGTLSAERFNWLNEQIADLDHDRVSSLDPVFRGTEPRKGIYTLALEGRRLEGAYTFGRDVAGRREFLVYIPKAPDGLFFRPIESLTEGLKARALGDHITRLVKLEDQGVMRTFVERCREAKGSPLATPVLRDSFPVVHFREEFQSMVQRLLYDLDHQTTTQAELFWRHVLIGVELVVDVISLFVPPVGLVASIVRITRAIVQGVIAYSQGDDEAGKAHLASAWRSAILLYVGFVAGVGTSTSAVGLLGQIKDISEIVSTATGVPVGIAYVTALAAPMLNQDSETRITG